MLRNFVTVTAAYNNRFFFNFGLYILLSEVKSDKIV